MVLPQLFGARNILRINHLQHAGCDPTSPHHSRDFLGRLFNVLLCNNGYHTVHHDRPGVHWSELPAAHAQLAPAPRHAEPGLAGYLVRRYLLAADPAC